MKKTTLLVIIDGYAVAPPGPDNAVTSAHTPNLDKIFGPDPCLLEASGPAVGLPEGQMGNSEVGHTAIGAGRVISGELSRINREIETGAFFENPVLGKLFDDCAGSGKALHLVGLLSDGGVHSLDRHVFALLRLAARKKLKQVYIHAALDGRDVSPGTATEHLLRLEQEISRTGTGRIATVGGRYFFMDRDGRYERTRAAYDAMTLPPTEIFPDICARLADCSERGITDEFVPVFATCPEGRISDGDTVLVFNFRPDRARQICRALADGGFEGFEREKVPVGITLATMTEYDKSFGAARPIYKKELPAGTLGQAVSGAGLVQLRLAETEKYAHVTFFLNGGREQPFPGEERILVPSPKVDSYDLAPEMSAAALTDKAIEAMGKFDFAVLNYANCDMVGHTGNLEATLEAVRTVDRELGRLTEAAERNGATLIVTADHGNAESMRAPGGGPMTAHTTNLVPFAVFGPESITLKKTGKLTDIAPTVLRVAGIKAPAEMTGESLIVS